MNILMLSDVYFPRVNGVSTSILTFRNALRQLGHEVTVVAPAYPQTGAVDPGIVRIPSHYLYVDPEDRVMCPRSLRTAVAALAGRRFDLLHIQTPFIAHFAGVRLARQFVIPCVETYHAFFEEYLFHYVPCLPRGLMRYLARSFTRRECAQLDALVGHAHGAAPCATVWAASRR
jgi:1,2-diacylglycerol 3-alpha-glucosyltransferase